MKKERLGLLILGIIIFIIGYSFIWVEHGVLTALAIFLLFWSNNLDKLNKD